MIFVKAVARALNAAMREQRRRDLLRLGRPTPPVAPTRSDSS